MSFYASELIPSLQADPKSGMPQEAGVLQGLKLLLDQKDWASLPLLIGEVMEALLISEVMETLAVVDHDKKRHPLRVRVFKALTEKTRSSPLTPVSQNYVRYVSDAERAMMGEYVAKTTDLKPGATVQEHPTVPYKSLRQLTKEREERERPVLLEKAKKLQEIEKARREEEEAKRREEQLRQEPIIEELNAALRISIETADRLAKKINREGYVDYDALKEKYIAGWLSQRVTPALNAEQITAIAKTPRSYLLRARAGSGKTHVIAAKTRYLINHDNVDPDRIMILTFNAQAATQLTGRIKTKSKQLDFEGARTFHSLAYKLVKPDSKILFDSQTGNTKRQSEFIQRLIKNSINPAFRAQVYELFRNEMKELLDIGAFMNQEDYYAYRRNQVYETLGGQRVKSTGEKWLADFLFEHGIYYVYEKIWYWSGGGNHDGNYQPDFSLTVEGNNPDIVIEHWGIDLESKVKKTPAHWKKSWQDYREEIDRKRQHWRNFNLERPEQKVLFLETSLADLRYGRSSFEKILAKKLREVGLRIEKLPEDELQKRVVTKRIGRFSKMCMQYIQKAKKRRRTPEQMRREIDLAPKVDSRTRTFLTIANRVYARYQSALKDQGRTDFDDLLEEAITRIHDSKGMAKIHLADDRQIAMRDLEWLMIDEFQDFSDLFSEMVSAIREYNVGLKLFCVGDDWQAINGFAGSDLRYFSRFRARNRGALEGNLANNYRSASEIVNAGNRFMAGKGEPAVAKQVKLSGSWEECCTDKVWIEQRPGDQYSEERNSDERFATYIGVGNDKRKVDIAFRIGRMLKKCNEIVGSEEYSADTTFAILSRVKSLGKGYSDLAAFHSKLKSTLTASQRSRFPNFDERVHCGTVHGYKGKEADVVIILGVNERIFPKLHPDNHLFGIFGENHSENFAEEERLFYVAITRAKQQLYLLTETGRKSEFLSRLTPDYSSSGSLPF